MRNKTICVFTEGDANKLATWSNVPYFLSTTLEKKGYKVYRIDISSMNFLKKLYNHSVGKLMNLIFPNHAYQFERTGLYNYLVEKKIGKNIKRIKNVDLIIIMSFSFYNKWNDIPTITFSDWSYDYYIRERCLRKPYFFEKNYIKRQAKSFTKATVVISLFKRCAKYIKTQYPKSNVCFLGDNVINAIEQPSADFSNLILQKQKEILILFIGMKKYLLGAQLLVNTFAEIKKHIPNAQLHIIGLDNDSLTNTSSDIYCHGYLHKDVGKEVDLYYDLLKKASVFVNPTEQWAGYSSMIEAMYFYTPVIVSPYKEFVDEFGEKINFGIYNKDFSVVSLEHSILSVLQTSDYAELCMNAHERVKKYTWGNYVEKLLKTINL